MLLRAMFGGAFFVILMAFSKNVYQLFFLRILQGIFGGTIGASTALVATVVPESSLGFSFSLLYTTIYLGSSIGPLVGGVIANYFGYRITLIFAGGLLFIGGLVVLGLVKEDFQLDLSKKIVL
jgi:DHA1 family multidrug resistance protein-like MFS transporter